MPVIPPLCGRALRGLVLFMFITAILISGTTITANAKTDAYQEITSRILNLFPAFAGKVQDVQGSTVVIQGTPDFQVSPGAYLMIKKETVKGSTPPPMGLRQAVLVSVTGVSGQEIRAERIGKQEIKKGDPVTGWPRPLPVALVPMSREALGVLMEYSPAKGDLAPVRTEDVLTAMIENHYADFSALGQMDLSVLGPALKTPLILQVKVLSGFGENILQMVPYAVESGAGLDTFSVLLSSRSTSMAEARPASKTTLPLPAAIPAENMDATPPQTGIDILAHGRPETEEAAAPLALPMAVAGSAVQPAMPKLPPLTGFDQPTRWVRILESDERIMSMAGGSFTDPAKRELAIGVPGKIQIYTPRQGTLKAGQRLEDPDLTTLFWLETSDLNGDGSDEIIVNTDQGVLVITQQQGALRIVHRKTGILIRKINHQLIAQTMEGLESGESSIHSVLWNGQDWIMEEPLANSESGNLFALVSVSEENAISLTPDHKLAVGQQTLSEEEFGQSNTPSLMDLPYPLFLRSFSTPDGTFLLRNRSVGWVPLVKEKYTNGGTLVLRPRGNEPSLLSPQFRGYLADLCVYDLDGNGTAEILLSQVDSSLFGGGAYILQYK